MNPVEPLSIERLLSQVTARSKAALGLVVHLGAGAAAPEDHAATRAQRLVLVEGDPDTAAALQGAVRDRQPEIEVVAQAVAPEAGLLSWRRYNSSHLNGPVDFNELRSIYPRLQERPAVERTAVAFDALLQRVSALRRPGSANVLLLDLPGQEHDLICSAAPTTLQLFDWIVLHTRRQAAASTPPPIAAGDWLSRAHYVLIESDAAAPGLWPWSVHQFDAALQQRVTRHDFEAAQSRAIALEQELRSLKDETNRLALENAALLAARDEQSRAARSAKEQAERLGAELADTGARYGMLQQELVKAEAQIELIANLLLQDNPH
jgi:hypothetical protein